MAALLGNQIASVYYGASPHHSYYNGCSAGGRQGISVASRHPDAFDGVLIGSPALDWNRLLGAVGVWASFVADNTSRAIPLPQWSTIVTPEVLRQCDWLDGRLDGIIADPSICSWNPETLLCTGPGGDDVTSCLSQDQVDGLKKFYRPILGNNGDVVAPAFDPGAEADLSLQFPMNGIMSIITAVRGGHPVELHRANLTHFLFFFLLHGRRSGTTMRYTVNPRDRLIRSPSLILNTRTPSTQPEYLLGQTLSTDWVNSGTKAGRSSHFMAPAIRWGPPFPMKSVLEKSANRDRLPCLAGDTHWVLQGFPRAFVLQDSIFRLG